MISLYPHSTYISITGFEQIITQTLTIILLKKTCTGQHVIQREKLEILQRATELNSSKKLNHLTV